MIQSETQRAAEQGARCPFQSVLEVGAIGVALDGAVQDGR